MNNDEKFSGSKYLLTCHSYGAAVGAELWSTVGSPGEKGERNSSVWMENKMNVAMEKKVFIVRQVLYLANRKFLLSH